MEKSNIERAEYILGEISELADNTKAEIENILLFNKSISVPVYDGGKIYTDGMNFKNSAGENIFFGGYLICLLYTSRCV